MLSEHLPACKLLNMRYSTCKLQMADKNYNVKHIKMNEDIVLCAIAGNNYILKRCRRTIFEHVYNGRHVQTYKLQGETLSVTSYRVAYMLDVKENVLHQACVQS